MKSPEGTLTPMQHEIMDIVWSRGKAGIAASEIWRQISERRAVGRTTILNQVDRLEKRGWLLRHKTTSSYHYVASKDREEIEGQLAKNFVDHFFRGSTSRLVASLLGSQRVSEEDVEQIRKLLSAAPSDEGADGVHESTKPNTSKE